MFDVVSTLFPRILISTLIILSSCSHYLDDFRLHDDNMFQDVKITLVVIQLPIKSEKDFDGIGPFLQDYLDNWLRSIEHHMLIEDNIKIGD